MYDDDHVFLLETRKRWPVKPRNVTSLGSSDTYSKAWEPKFGSSAPMQNPSMMVHIWNPSTEEGGRGADKDKQIQNGKLQVH